MGWHRLTGRYGYYPWGRVLFVWNICKQCSRIHLHFSCKVGKNKCENTQSLAVKLLTLSGLIRKCFLFCFNYFIKWFNVNSACRRQLCGKLKAAFHWIQQVNEASCNNCSSSLKHDEHGDISKPSGKSQKTDIGLMSSHATMKTTRNTTQDALPYSFREKSWSDLRSGLSAFVTYTLTQDSSSLAVKHYSCNFLSLRQLTD